LFVVTPFLLSAFNIGWCENQVASSFDVFFRQAVLRALLHKWFKQVIICKEGCKAPHCLVVEANLQMN